MYLSVNLSLHFWFLSLSGIYHEQADLVTICMQSMAEQLAENYHNTWGRKKKVELQAKGNNRLHILTFTLSGSSFQAFVSKNDMSLC